MNQTTGRVWARRMAGAEIWLLLVYIPLLMFPNRYSPLAVALAGAVWVCRRLGTGHWTRRSPLDGPIVLLLVAVLVGLYASSDLSLSQLKAYGILLGVITFYALINNLHSPPGVWLTMNVFWAAGLASSVLGWLGMYMPWQKLFVLPQVYRTLTQRLILPGLLVGRGYHPNEVAGTLAMLIPPVVVLLFVWTWKDRSRLKWLYRLWVTVCLLLMAGLLLLTQSRSAMVALATTLAVIGLLYQRRFLLPIPFVVIALAVAASFTQVSADFLADYATVRLSLWRQALHLIQEYPLTGVGLNTFRLVSQLNYPFFLLTPFDNTFQGIVIADLMNVHAHNIFLHTWVDLGLLGFLAFLAILVIFGQSAWRVLSHKQPGPFRAYAIGLIGGMTAYLTFGLIDTITLGAKPGLVFWIILALMVSMDLQLNTQRQTMSRPGIWPGSRTGRVIVGLTVIVVLIVAARPWLGNVALNLASIELHKALLQPGLTLEDQQALFRRAETWLDRAQVLSPGRALVYRVRGRVHVARGERDLAAQALAQATRLDPTDPFAHFDLGQTYEVLGQRDAAIGEWRAAGADIYFLDRGERLAASGAWDEAIEAYLLAARSDPYSEDAFDQLVSACEQTGRWDEAITVYEEAVPQEPNPAIPHMYLGVLLWRGKRDYNQSIAHLEMAIQLEPNQVKFYERLGTVYREAGDVQQAIATYTEAVALEPRLGRLHRELGHLYGDAKQIESAIREYELALQYDPQDQVALEALMELGESD